MMIGRICIPLFFVMKEIPRESNHAMTCVVVGMDRREERYYERDAQSTKSIPIIQPETTF